MKHIKEGIAIVLAIGLSAGGALAEHYTGSIYALTSTPVSVCADGTLEHLYVSAGQAVAEGDLIASVRETKVFATQDGTVASIDAAVGDQVGEASASQSNGDAGIATSGTAVSAMDGAMGTDTGSSAAGQGTTGAGASTDTSSDASGDVLSIAPLDRYTIYCTSDEAYSDPENMLIHGGETVYVSCTSNGTHRAIGTVSQIDGETYTVSVFGGELYIGETVYLYRTDSFEKADRVGIGTVVSSDAETYQASGTITNICVSVGESVERGQLLYTYVSGDEPRVYAACTGVIDDLSCAQGDSVQQDQIIASIVSDEDVAIGVQVEEADAKRLSIGEQVKFIRADDPTETEYTATIYKISGEIQNGYCTVVLTGADVPLRIGLSIDVEM